MLETLLVTLQKIWFLLVEHELQRARETLEAAGLLKAETERQLLELRAKLVAVKIPTPAELQDEWAQAEARGRARVTGEPPTFDNSDGEP